MKSGAGVDKNTDLSPGDLVHSRKRNCSRFVYEVVNAVDTIGGGKLYNLFIVYNYNHSVLTPRSKKPVQHVEEDLRKLSDKEILELYHQHNNAQAFFIAHFQPGEFDYRPNESIPEDYYA